MFKKILLPLLALAVISACNNGGKEHDHEGMDKDSKTVAKTPGQQLYDEVMEAHDAVMPKMGKLRGAQDRAKAMLDSLSKLSPKAQDAAVGLKTQLETLVNDLNYADYAMDKWMTEFSLDSAQNEVDALRVKYLQPEKEKVTKVKDAVLNGLAKADSLFKTTLTP